MYLRGASGVVLVYDVTNMDSFTDVGKYLVECHNNALEEAVLMLVGHKADRHDRCVVQTADARAYAAEHGMLFVETSSQEGANVDLALFELASEIVNRQQRRQLRSSVHTPPPPPRTPSAGVAPVDGGAPADRLAVAGCPAGERSHAEKWAKRRVVRLNEEFAALQSMGHPLLELC
jgi:hypothetical protein